MESILKNWKMIKYHDIIYDYPIDLLSLKGIYIQNAKDGEDFICKKLEDIFSEISTESEMKTIIFNLSEWINDELDLLAMISFIQEKYFVYLITDLTEWEFKRTVFGELLNSNIEIELHNSFKNENYVYKHKGN